MSDISREFLDELEKEFNRRYSASKKIQSLVRKLNSSKATSQDAFDYAKEVGNLRKLVLHDLITEDILNDGYLGYYNAKTLFDDVLFKNYELINKYCMNAFTQINKDAGINLKGVSVEYDQEKTDGIVECAVKGRYTETRDETEEAVVTNAKGYYDSSVRKNADTQYKAGLKPKIIRTAVGKTCKWCQSVAGTYDYREVSNKGNDVFRRHANCDCLVIYQPSKGSYQDVHSKQWMDTKEYKELQHKRIEYSERKGNNSVEKLSRNTLTNHLDPIYVRSKYVKPLEGYDDVFIHGDEYGFAYKDADGNEISLSVNELAEILNENGQFENNKIRLCACGAGGLNSITAQKLADYTKKEVLAPTKILWIYPEKNGVCDMIIAGEDDLFPDIPNTNDLGEWKSFYPNKEK